MTNHHSKLLNFLIFKYISSHPSQQGNLNFGHIISVTHDPGDLFPASLVSKDRLVVTWPHSLTFKLPCRTQTYTTYA